MIYNFSSKWSWGGKGGKYETREVKTQFLFYLRVLAGQTITESSMDIVLSGAQTFHTCTTPCALTYNHPWWRRERDRDRGRRRVSAPSAHSYPNYTTSAWRWRQWSQGARTPVSLYRTNLHALFEASSAEDAFFPKGCVWSCKHGRCLVFSARQHGRRQPTSPIICIWLLAFSHFLMLGVVEGREKRRVGGWRREPGAFGRLFGFQPWIDWWWMFSRIFFSFSCSCSYE